MEKCKRQNELLDSRLRDTVHMMNMVSGMLKKTSNGTVIATATPTGDLFALKEREQTLKELLRDCDQFISLYMRDVNTRFDGNRVRDSTVDALLARVRSVTGLGRTENWSNSDVLLLLQRLKEKESLLVTTQEKYDLVIQDMMAMENERDDMKKKIALFCDVDARAVIKVEVATSKQQVQQKDAELQTWKQAAARNADLGNQRFSYDRNPQFGYTTAAYPM